MSEHAKDVMLAAALIAVGVAAVVIINATKGQVGISGTDFVGFETLPTIYGGLLAVLSAVYLAGSVRKLRRDRQRPIEPRPPGAVRTTVAVRTFGALAALIVYAFLLESVHFLFLTAAFLVALFLLFGQRNPWRIGIASAAGAAGLYGLFIVGLDLPI